MTTQTARHDIQDGLYVYQQNNSQRWYCRFVLYGKWYSKATKEKDLDKAKAKAQMIFMEYQIKADNNLLVDSKRFKDVALKAIENMKNELEHGGGKVTYRDYIQALNKYHIPYFDRTYITSIDQEKIRQFNQWRIEQFGRIPAKSTIQTHNSALQMVFKEAIERKWMIPMQVPVLNSDGETGQRRAAFSEEEYYKVYHAIEALMENSRKEKTRQIRELLLSYIEFAVHTGIRPGTEMDNLTWGNIKFKRQKHKAIFSVKVTKGKTTKHTGTRTVVCKDEIFDVLDELRDRFPNRKPSDKLFRLADGSTTNELGKAFDLALKESDLKESPDGPRTLYSLRHTYITWQLLNRELRLDVLAKQCGTSVAMLEQHYSHVVPTMFEEELSGVKLQRNKKPYTKEIKSQKHIERLTELFKSWEANYRARGCI